MIKNDKNYLVGLEAVIDKDLASSLLATDLKADVFIITTDVERVSINYGAPNEKWLNSLELNRARALYEADHFDPGSMGPKVLAMINYLESGGKSGIITNQNNLIEAIADKSGTKFYSQTN